MADQASDAEYLRMVLEQQGISTTADDLTYVQRVLSIIRDGEKELDAFPDLENEKIMLLMDMEVVRDD